MGSPPNSLHLHPTPHHPHIMQAAALTTSFVARVAPTKASRFTSNATQVKVSAKALPSWSPGAKRPAYLDGSMTGDYGFDPLGLGKDPAALARFQEAEIIHCRWAMLGAAGVIAVEALGYGDWLSAATSSTQTYFGTAVPVGDIGALLGIEFLALAFVEAKRNAETSTGSTPLANWAAHVADPWHMNVSLNAKAL